VGANKNPEKIKFYEKIGGNTCIFQYLRVLSISRNGVTLKVSPSGRVQTGRLSLPYWSVGDKKIGGILKMNKVELVAAVAEKTGLTKKDAEKAVSATIDSVIEAVASGEKVQLVGFGTFEVRERSERVGRNPRTKQQIVIPATKVPAFKAGKAFKDVVAKK